MQIWSLKTGIVFDDRFNYIEIKDLLPGISCLSKQLVSHGSQDRFHCVTSVDFNKSHSNNNNNVL